jgi:hypothetical protein
MSQLLNGSICLSDIPKDLIYKSEKTGKSYLNINVWINDEADKFGNNASIQISQTKEQRDAGEPKKYVGNLKTVQAKEQTGSAPVKKTAPATESFDDLPF